MRRWTPLVLPVVLFVVGCGSQSHPVPSTVTTVTVVPTRTTPATRTQPTCVVREPAGAGECVRQAVEAKGVTPAAIPFSESAGADPAPQCVDISKWQGVFNFRAAGVQCAIIQTNDGGFGNPLFFAQAAEARNARIPFGVYTFVEGGCGGCEAATSFSVAKGSGYSLGAWADAEVPAAYPVACTVVNALHVHYRIVGVYGSPGTYRGGRCQGYLWPAEWGGGQAYSFAGYPRSAVKIRQWSGTSHLLGQEIDRDEDLGLLALAHPAPSHAQVVARWKRELDVAYVLRNELHADIDRHHCRLTPPTLGHAKPPSYHTACAYWLRHGQVEVRRIAAFHAKGVF
jgi:hypothetical protein